MYMAYGWPQVIPLEPGLCPVSQKIVYIKLINRLLLVVAPSHLELWSCSQHKIRLGKYKRDSESVQLEGEYVQAVWSPDTKLIALVTSSFFLHIFKVQFTEKRLQVGGKQPSRLFLANINLVLNEQVPFADKNLAMSNIVCDNKHLLVGLSDGSLQLISWKGEFSGIFELDYSPRDSDDITQPSQFLENGRSSEGVKRDIAATQVFSNRSAITQLDFSLLLRLLVVLYSDGQLALCSVSKKGLKQIESIKAERWLDSGDAVCVSVASDQQILAVGSKRGLVELYDLAESASLLRTVSLYDWGYSMEDTGSVSCIEWAPDNSAFAVGWKLRGLTVWSLSGCRLMCTIRQIGLSSASSPVVKPNQDFKYEPLMSGTSVMQWDEYGYRLYAIEEGSMERILSFSFGKCCFNRGVSGTTHIRQVIYSEDRLLVVQSEDTDELKILHLSLPSSLLCRKTLLGKPIVMDVFEDYILVTYRPLDVHIFYVKIMGELSPSNTPILQLSTVRELSIMTAKNHPAAMRFIPEQHSSEYSSKQNFSSLSDSLVRQPSRCLILRTNGELSLLDLDEGRERELTDSVELFWVTCGQSEEKANLIEEVSWLNYGHRGMQVWYPSPGVDPFKQEDFLQRNKNEEALRLARLSAEKPHFSHCLEWLLFTVFDAEISRQSSSKNQAIPKSTTAFSLLEKTCDLIRNFPEYHDVVVSVARKTDGRHWADLFAAAGRSTELFEECFQRRWYRTAACYILSAHVASVKSILENHASYLMSGKELSKLVAFVKGTQFDLVEYLQRERSGSARLENFASGLELIGEKLQMGTLQSRLDAEFLLAHMCSVKFKEWIVVLATLLRRSEVLFDLFRHDMRLWKAYSITLQSQPAFAEYYDLLRVLEEQLSSIPNLEDMQVNFLRHQLPVNPR
ncbi:hypothetical protein C5167_015448 [Papaver somniferum]|uniref:RIC1 C-terminal alpha solenoid region domain-containing protein n=1 Tax=Papaver somniferum TaxID=3469 RepID=A0A4Y7J7Y7_PAPSO|nr:hypothetical protein C5167_015448 [Papaver somniferum]